MDWFIPGTLFNVTTAPEPLSGWQVIAGPMGLALFLPLAPLMRLLAIWSRWLSIALCSLAWLVLTLNPRATAIFLGLILVGAAFVYTLGALRRRDWLSQRQMIALVWIGLHLMALPFWLHPDLMHYGWEHGAIAALHALGLAYYLFRYVDWGVALARDPHQPARLGDTICWILYPPCMRLGPVLRRATFFERLETWRPRKQAPVFPVLRRFGLFLLGGIGLLLVLENTPRVAPGQPDFFAAPEQYSLAALVRLYYLLPIQIYLILWTYNELAKVTSLLVGIEVDNNFDWLPLATDTRTFWRRWHVTVGAWLRDHVYIPLGGNRMVPTMGFIAVFGYCAVWHGASWSFIAWGMLQALALAWQRVWEAWRARLPAPWVPRGPVWSGACWLVTMHFQIFSIVVFVDFEHSGVRFFRELITRFL